MLHEQLMVSSFALTVNDDVGAVAVGAEEDGVAIDISLGEPRQTVDGLEQGVCDAVGEADELDVGVFAGPLGDEGVDELEGRLLRVGAVVAQGNEADKAVVA